MGLGKYPLKAFLKIKESEEKKMTHEEIRKEINRLNEEMELFISETIPTMLGCKNGVTLSKWFDAQKILNESGKKQERRDFLEKARKEGHNVKINMQTYALMLNREPVYNFAIFYVEKGRANQPTWIGQRTTTTPEMNEEMNRLSNQNPDKVFYYERLWGADS